MENFLFLSYIFLIGITMGSFLNVCILRIPLKVSIVTTPSHCMHCGYRLRWYDLIPVASYLILGGRCRKCGERISLQYPFIEVLNGILYVIVFMTTGFELTGILYCLLASALLVLSVIDFKTFEIPLGINIFIACLGAVRVITDRADYISYLTGAFLVSSILLLLYLLSKGRAIGGGDIKLMAAAGLLLGYEKVILSFLLGCIAGSVIHLIRMRLQGEKNVLALGPYLALGIFLAALWGESFINWYMGLLK